MTDTTLAVGGRDGTVTLWNLDDSQPLGPPLMSSQVRTIYALVFSLDGQRLFAGSSDASVVQYELQPRRWIEQLCTTVGRNLTPDERHVYLGDPTAGRQTCPNWPADP